MPNCDHCNTKTQASYSQAFNKILCGTCKFSEPYKMMYKTTAKNNYFLTPRDLDSVETFIGPKVRQKITNLVRETDIQNVFCQKYNISLDQIKNKLTELQEIKESRKTKALDKKNQVQAERRKTLIDALAIYKLELRNDSRLCQGYIDGTITDWTLDGVVKRMCQMHFLFNYANMDDCLEQAREHQREEMEAGYFPDCSVFEQAEMIALRNNRYPSTWPWVEEMAAGGV